MVGFASTGALVEIALAAGAEIMAIYGRDDVGVEAKGDGSPVTAADKAAERVILERLNAVAPGVPVVAEEAVSAGAVPDTGGAFYLVDPLDGTKEFLSRNGEFTVNIALVEGGVPTAGVVCVPAQATLYAGDAAGAWTARIEAGAPVARRAIRAAEPRPSGLVVVASRSHLTEETRAFIERFEVASFTSAGSSLKFCRVASGDADLYPRLARTMEWDTAAGDAVLRAAGGTVRTMDGMPLAYGKRNQRDDVDFANPWFVASGRFDPFTLSRGPSGPL